MGSMRRHFQISMNTVSLAHILPECFHHFAGSKVEINKFWIYFDRNSMWKFYACFPVSADLWSSFEHLSSSVRPYKNEDLTRGPWILPIRLTTTVSMTMIIFCRHVTHCCRVKWLKSWDNSHTIQLIILDHFNTSCFDLPRSLQVKCDAAIGLHIYDLLLMINSNIWDNSAPLQDIALRNLSDNYLSRSLRSNAIAQMDSPHIFPVNVK